MNEVEFKIGDTVRVEQFLRGKHGDVYEVVSIGYDRLVFGGKSTRTGRHCPIMARDVIEVVPAGTIGEVEPPPIPRAYRPLADLTPAAGEMRAWSWPTFDTAPAASEVRVWRNPEADLDGRWDEFAETLTRPSFVDRYHLRLVLTVALLVAVAVLAMWVDYR